MTTESLRVGQVFVPGKLPRHTYNPRSTRHLERDLEDYLDEAGSILTVSGPTKSGKTVLVRRVVEEAVWVDSQGMATVDEMWRRAGDELQVYTNYEVDRSREDAVSASVEGSAGLGPVLSGTAGGGYVGSDSSGSRHAVSRPLSTVVMESLRARQRPLVIDDFHFVDRAVQKEIVRALKPLVFAGVPIILVSISHRARDVVTAEPDMTGRVTSLDVDLWDHDELSYIAQQGFAALGVKDPGSQIANGLADNSFGSPHLMQKFCRESCKASGVREKQAIEIVLREPPQWPVFFQGLVDESSENWFQRLLRGPQERGSARTQWPIDGDKSLDGYGVTLAAIAKTGPELTLSKDKIKSAVDSVVKGTGPAPHQTTRVLQHMSKIAATRVNETVPTEEELDELEEPNVLADVQPVLEYVEDGPNSALHIADPFFAFYLRWAASAHLERSTSQPTNAPVG